MTCNHATTLMTRAKVIHMEEDGPDSQRRFVEIDITCKACGAKAEWVGLPAGMSYANPIDGLELRAPVLMRAPGEPSGVIEKMLGTETRQ
jgi:hypothetical protein